MERVSTCEHVIQGHSINRLQLGLLIWANTDSIVIFLLLVCRRAHVLFAFFVIVCVSWCPTHVILCFGVFYFILSDSLDYPFWLPLLVFSANVYWLEALLTWTNNRSFPHFFCFRKKRTHSSSSSYTLSSSKHSTMTRSEWISDAVNRNDDINTQKSSSSDSMHEPNNHLSNEFLGNIPHFAELSATC